jgi:hypothetical protein
MVVFVDRVTGLTAISPLYSAYPKIPNAPPAALAIFSISMWVWWLFTTHPMLYQWTKEIVFRHVTRKRRWIGDRDTHARYQQRHRNEPELPTTRPAHSNLVQRRKQATIGAPMNDQTLADNATIVAHLNRQNLLSTPPTANRTPPSPTNATSDYFVNEQGLAKLCPHENDTEDNLSFSDRRFIDRYSPIDMDTINVLLHVVRITVFWTIFYSLSGFDSARFAERLARSANVSSSLGSVMYYGVMATMVVLTGLCSSDFVERYSSMAFYMIEIVLLLATWLNQLPDVNGSGIDLATNLIISGWILSRIYQWVLWVLIRGPDWIDARYFQLMNDVASIRPSSIGPVNEVMSAPAGPLQSSLFYLWVLVLTPLGTLFFYYMNVAPIIEMIWNSTPLRTSIAWLLIVCSVLFAAFVFVSKLQLQVLYEISLRFQKRWQDIRAQIVVIQPPISPVQTQ